MFCYFTIYYLPTTNLVRFFANTTDTGYSLLSRYLSDDRQMLQGTSW